MIEEKPVPGESMTIHTDLSFLSAALTFDMQSQGFLQGSQGVVVTSAEVNGDELTLEADFYELPKTEVN